MSALIIDASVAVKWFVSQEGSKLAEAILGTDHVLHAPDLMRVETANGLWQHVRAGHIHPDHAQRGLAELLQIINVWHGSASLLSPALAIGTELNHPIYDCIYLALASALEAPIVTADARLCAKVAPTPYSHSCVALEDFSANSAPQT